LSLPDCCRIRFIPKKGSLQTILHLKLHTTTFYTLACFAGLATLSFSIFGAACSTREALCSSVSECTTGLAAPISWKKRIYSRGSLLPAPAEKTDSLAGDVAPLALFWLLSHCFILYYYNGGDADSTILFTGGDADSTILFTGGTPMLLLFPPGTPMLLYMPPFYGV